MKVMRPYQKEALKTCFSHLKNSDDPILLYASVGAGKSLIIAELLRMMERANRPSLMITSTAELVRNNVRQFIEQGGHPAVFSSSLKAKDYNRPIIFGTAQSVYRAIRSGHPMSQKELSLIVIDEGHLMNDHNVKSLYMVIYDHYKKLNPNMRCVGMTGTPYRFNGRNIVGEERFYKQQCGNIEMSWLIDEGYLVRPEFVSLDHMLDFSRLKVNAQGKFKAPELEAVITKSQRITGLILEDVKCIIESGRRKGAFIFAATVRHVLECMEHLPKDETGVIIGSTPEDERNRLFTLAREGKIKYLVNVNILTTGIDIPNFDMVVFLRPTESLVLFVQMLGRGLRTSEGKKDCLVMDCAGNLVRHADWDDPLIETWTKQANNPEDFCIPCPQCQTLNLETGRRCIGRATRAGSAAPTPGERCSFMFQFKPCEYCGAPNDITARICRRCDQTLIDPEKRLEAPPVRYDVIKSSLLYSFRRDEVFLTFELMNYGFLNVNYYLGHDKGKKRFLKEIFARLAPILRGQSIEFMSDSKEVKFILDNYCTRKPRAVWMVGDKFLKMEC